MTNQEIISVDKAEDYFNFMMFKAGGYTLNKAQIFYPPKNEGEIMRKKIYDKLMEHSIADPFEHGKRVLALTESHIEILADELEGFVL